MAGFRVMESVQKNKKAVVRKDVECIIGQERAN